MSIFSIALLIFGVSQIYWAWRIYRFLAARIGSRGVLWSACGGLIALYILGYQYGMGSWRDRSTPVHLTASDALLAAPFLCWAASSLFAFFVALLFAIPRGIRWVVRRLVRRCRSPRLEIESPARRDLLTTAANVCAAAPFVAGSYGLLYGRLNLETVQQTIHLPRLPRAFDGFRICQLSDIHIGPFMPAGEIQKYVAIANEQKPHLIVLTGDYVTFDPSTQEAVVDALRGLRAPFGVYGSLGNHDAWAGVEDSITALFRQVGIRILRGENAAIRSGTESINLVGVDFQSAHRFGPSPPVKNLLGNIEGLVDPHRVNILLSHNPDTFERAAQIGVDLSLAGHTHGGQAALEFISPEIAPSRLVTPYVAGLFQRPGSQLYVNRGIGTIFIPIRIGAPPELTVYTLVS
jgi:uncharacterized protein